MRAWIDNLPIAAKAMLALAILALSGLGAGLHAVSRLADTNALYTRLLDQDARGTIDLVQANVALHDDGRVLNRMIAETDRAQVEALAHELAAIRRRLAQNLAEAVRQKPSIAQEVRAIEARYARLVEITREIEAAAIAGQRERALMSMRDRRTPVYLELRTAMNEMVERLEDGMLAAANAATAAADAAWWRVLILLLGGAALALLAALWLMIGGVSRPLVSLAARMAALKEGDKQSPIPGKGRRDEVGRMAESLESFRLAAIEADRVAAASAAEAAAKVARGERVDALVRRFEADAADALRIVASAATELDATAQQMRSSAEGGTERAGALATASEEASANVQTVAASAEQMSVSIAEVARQVAETARVARQAAEDARASDAAVTGLANAASRINEVVKLIGGIAGQTNLLALNATIEAARAGEAGKGFAVVAGEVKALAAQTAKATEEIGAHIAAMQAETDRAVAAIRGIAGTIQGMDGLTAQVAAAAEEQAAAVQEIGRAVTEAATNTTEVSRHAAGTAEAAQETGAAATQLRASAGELAQRAEALRGQVDGFLGAIRAA